MASFQDGLLQFRVGQGQLVAGGMSPVVSADNPATFATGLHSDVVLPGLAPAGPLLYEVTSSASGAEMGGIVSTDIDLGTMLILVNANAVGGESIELLGSDSASAVGNRFSSTIEVAPGNAVWLIYLALAGVKYWCAFFATSS